jgi:hypothetical protein
MIPVILISLFLVSCSDSEKFDIEKSRQIQEVEIGYEEDGTKLYLYGLWIENGRCCSSLNNNYLYSYFWVINGDTAYSISPSHEVGYGLHFVTLVLVDAFGDTIAVSDSIYMPEPLRITLLSPIDSFKVKSTDTTPVFEYKINKERANSHVYVSTDKESLWEEENRYRRDRILKPPFFWGVKAFTEQDTVFSKEIRWVQLQN